MRISDWSSDVCSSDLREARGARGLDVEPEPRPQPLGDRLAQAGTRIGAGEDADQRDADLYRRQEAPRIGGKLPRDLGAAAPPLFGRSEEHTSELQSLMRISYAVFCLKKKKTTTITTH